MDSVIVDLQRSLFAYVTPQRFNTLWDCYLRNNLCEKCVQILIRVLPNIN